MKSNEARQFMNGMVLSGEDLEIAKANLRFALENCPVDGGILTEGGTASSEESVRALLKKLEASKAHQANSADLSEAEVGLLTAIEAYAVQECPIDGALMLETGRMITKADLRALKEKVMGAAKVTVSKDRPLSALETLEEEHRLILRVVRLLPLVRQDVEAGEVDERVLSDIIEFFSTFTDSYHHAKEEGLLFPALQQEGVSSKGCPVGTLGLEHQQGRRLMKALSAALKGYKGGDDGEANTISEIIASAAEMYTDHVWREDYLLFPMSEKVLSSSDREALGGDFAGVEAKFGSGFVRRYESLVERLENSIAQRHASGHATGTQPSIVSS